MSGKVSTHSEVMEKVIDHAISIYPEECCGFLYGNDIDGIVEVRMAKSMHNERTDKRNRRFLINPEQYLEAEKFADKSGFQLVGVYHSHPDHQAVPSQYDLEMAFPSFLYLIVSVNQESTTDTRWWQLSQDRTQFIEVKFINTKVKENKR